MQCYFLLYCWIVIIEYFLFLLKVFENSIQQHLYDRLLYILCSQNWEHCGGHYWIKQCIEVSILSI